MPYQHLQGNSNPGCMGCDRDCGCTGIKTSTPAWLGEFAATSAFSEAEMQMVASEINKIVDSSRQPNPRDVNQISDKVFFARYPGSNGRLIDPKTEPSLAAEWKIIRSRMVLPILKAIDFRKKGNDALRANQVMLAVRFYDRARRISVSPAELRAKATFNLGQASRRLRRFAAAIGYFEVVRTFPGISPELRALAEKNLALAKEEYSRAVPTT